MGNRERLIESKSNYEGRIFDTAINGKLLVTEYVNKNTVCVKFLDTGYETVTRMSQIKEGKVRDASKINTVMGIASTHGEVTKIEGKHVREYVVWRAMLERCYNSNDSTNPSYTVCSVSDNFKSFKYFKSWCNKQIGFNQDDFQLDKDILSTENKIYSEDTCVFVPREVNMFFAGKVDNQCTGIYWHKRDKKWYATISCSGVVTHLGSFKTEKEAFNVYLSAKIKRGVFLAEKWKDKVDNRVYEALINWNVCEDR